MLIIAKVCKRSCYGKILILLSISRNFLNKTPKMGKTLKTIEYRMTAEVFIRIKLPSEIPVGVHEHLYPGFCLGDEFKLPS